MGKLQMYVRLKPHNPRRGHVLRRFCYKGKVFHVGRWYKVSERLAQQLADLHQKHYDEDSPYAFDVATEAQARAIEDKERTKEEAERKKVDRAEVVAAQEVRDDALRPTGALTSAALARAEAVEDEPEPEASADGDRELGVSMANSKDELVDVAESLGVEIKAGMTKRDILDAIEAELADDEDSDD